MSKTYKVVCSLPNASDEINGVAFEQGDGGMVATGVEQDMADRFASVEGYDVVEEGVEPASKSGLSPVPTDYAKMGVGQVKDILVKSPHLADRVMADEEGAGKVRPGVATAVEDAKKALAMAEAPGEDGGTGADPVGGEGSDNE